MLLAAVTSLVIEPLPSLVVGAVGLVSASIAHLTKRIFDAVEDSDRPLKHRIVAGPAVTRRLGRWKLRLIHFFFFFRPFSRRPLINPGRSVTAEIPVRTPRTTE